MGQEKSHSLGVNPYQKLTPAFYTVLVFVILNVTNSIINVLDSFLNAYQLDSVDAQGSHFITVSRVIEIPLIILGVILIKYIYKRKKWTAIFFLLFQVSLVSWNIYRQSQLNQIINSNEHVPIVGAYSLTKLHVVASAIGFIFLITPRGLKTFSE